MIKQPAISIPKQTISLEEIVQMNKDMQSLMPSNIGKRVIDAKKFPKKYASLLPFVQYIPFDKYSQFYIRNLKQFFDDIEEYDQQFYILYSENNINRSKWVAAMFWDILKHHVKGFVTIGDQVHGNVVYLDDFIIRKQDVDDIVELCIDFKEKNKLQNYLYLFFTTSDGYEEILRKGHKYFIGQYVHGFYHNMKFEIEYDYSEETFQEQRKTVDYYLQAKNINKMFEESKQAYPKTLEVFEYKGIDLRELFPNVRTTDDGNAYNFQMIYFDHCPLYEEMFANMIKNCLTMYPELVY